jgi:1,4-dihydroxy-2-naphthoyl-CoA hydrolase
MTTPAPPDDDSELERGFIKLVGLRIGQASGDRVVLTCPVTPDLHQPYGLVLGGVHATLA